MPILINCKPSLELLTINVLAAADKVLIPMQPHYYAAEGLQDLLRSISLIQTFWILKMKILQVGKWMSPRGNRKKKQSRRV